MNEMKEKLINKVFSLPRWQTRGLITFQNKWKFSALSGKRRENIENRIATKNH